MQPKGMRQLLAVCATCRRQRLGQLIPLTPMWQLDYVRKGGRGFCASMASLCGAAAWDLREPYTHALPLFFILECRLRWEPSSRRISYRRRSSRRSMVAAGAAAGVAAGAAGVAGASRLWRALIAGWRQGACGPER